MGFVLISTLYTVDSVHSALAKYQINELILLMDADPHKNQIKHLQDLKKQYSERIKIREVRIPKYDVFETTKKCLDLIDTAQSRIIANITTGRKPQAFGLQYACFKRPKKVEKIIYMVEETREIIELPVISFDITTAQIGLLRNIHKNMSIDELAKTIERSRAMAYRIINTLTQKGLIEDLNGELRVTDSGKIALL